MQDAERLQRIERILEEIQELADEGALIIVEGRKDRAALNELGISGEILLVSYPPLFNFAENISRKANAAIIMTDWDSKGKMLAKKMSTYLRSYGLKPDLRLRGKLRKLVQKEIKDVEGLNKYVRALRYKVHEHESCNKFITSHCDISPYNIIRKNE